MKIQSIAVTLAVCLPLSAHAANWVDVLATEPADAAAIKPFGFVQPTYTHIDADPLSGMGGAATSANRVTRSRRPISRRLMRCSCARTAGVW